MSSRGLLCAALISAGLATISIPAVQAEEETNRFSGSGIQSVETPHSVAPDSVAPDSDTSSLLSPNIELSDSIKTDLPTKAPMVVIVDKEHHVTHVLQNHNGTLVDVFRAANTTGKKSTPTPDGRMKIVEKRWDPVWKPPVSIDAKQTKVESYSKNRHNPLGVAWMGLNQGCIGLHGTNDPSKIGLNASHGCVRHKNEDIKKLYGLLPVGTPVYIVEKYAGTHVQSDDVDYLNGGIQATMVAQINPGDMPNHP